MRQVVVNTLTSTFMIGIGMMSLASLSDWVDISEGNQATYSLQDLKAKLVQKSDLFASHNAVYEKVGEEKWETTVKTDFMGQLMSAVISDTGNAVPSEDDVLNWVEQNKDRVKAMMDSYGNVMQKVEKENQTPNQ